MATAEVRKYHNGIRYLRATKKKALALRRRGHTHGEIVNALGISRGSAYLWTKQVKLTKRQKQLIEIRRNKRIFTEEQRREISRRLAPIRQKYTKQDLLNKIVGFYKKYGRIPLKREFNSLRTFRRHFGSWNNAISAAGFKPNPELFAKRVIARDGHICDSFAEKIIDDWLTNQKISHTRNVPYPGTRMTADFYIETHDLFIEFFGLKGVNKKYDSNIQRKIRIVRQKKLNLIALSATDLINNVFIEKLQICK